MVAIGKPPEIVSCKTVSYETILSNGYQIPVISMQMRYIHPCRYNQKVEITATIKPSIRMLIIEYEMRDSESHLKLSTAETKHLAFSNEKQSALFKLPNFMLKKLGEINE